MIKMLCWGMVLGQKKGNFMPALCHFPQGDMNYTLAA